MGRDSRRLGRDDIGEGPGAWTHHGLGPRAVPRGSPTMDRRCRAGCLMGPWVVVDWVEGTREVFSGEGRKVPTWKTWNTSLQGLLTFTFLSSGGA